MYIVFVYALCLLMLLQMLYFLQYFFEFKTKDTLYYALFIFFNLLYTLVHERILLPSNFILLLESYLNVISISSVGFYYLFIQHLLNLHGQNKPLNKLFNILTITNMIVVSILVSLAIVNIDSNILLFAVSILSFPLYIYIIVCLGKMELPYSRYITFALIILVFGMSTSALLSIIHYYYPSFDSTFITLPSQIGLLGDLVLFNIAINKKNAISLY